MQEGMCGMSTVVVHCMTSDLPLHCWLDQETFSQTIGPANLKCYTQ